MSNCPAFDLPFSGDPQPVLRAFANRVLEVGGLLTGNEKQGAFIFQVPVLGRSVKGAYVVQQSAVRVTIVERPDMVPCNLLEGILRVEGQPGAAAAPGGPVVTGPIATEFTLEVRFLGGLTASQQAVFMKAAARWSRVIVGDLPAVRLPSGEVIDDLVINARGVFIDGAGKVLGRAGPTGLRQGSLLPVTGMMEFDTEDLAQMEFSGGLENVIVHEMGHVLGIGSLWGQSFFNLVQGIGGPNPLYVGRNAVTEFARLLGSDTLRGVPVENTGGQGTRDSHWRENVFLNELMTGFIGPGSNPLSRLSVAALQDLGYKVNLDAADPYSMPSALNSHLLGTEANLHACGCDGSLIRPQPMIFPKEFLMGS